MTKIYKSITLILIAITIQSQAARPERVWSDLEKTKLRFKAELFDTSVRGDSNFFDTHQKINLENFNEKKMKESRGALVLLNILSPEQAKLFKKKYTDKKIIKDLKEQIQNRIFYDVSGQNVPDIHTLQIQGCFDRACWTTFDLFKSYSIMFAYRHNDEDDHFKILLFTFE